MFDVTAQEAEQNGHYIHADVFYAGPNGVNSVRLCTNNHPNKSNTIFMYIAPTNEAAQSD